MCGRYASARSVDDIAGAFGISDSDVDDVPAPSWNVAPTQPVAAVVERDGRPCLTTLRWGLVPNWADTATGGATLFNARVETVADKPAFRDAVRRHRCLIPADGWYEWARLPDGRRVPHFLTRDDGDVVAFAGIWDSWRDAEGRELRSTAILTGPAPPDLRHIHDRAPVVLSRAEWRSWLARDAAPDLPAPTSAGVIRLWPVGDQVGDVRTDGPALAAPVQLDEQPPLF